MHKTKTTNNVAVSLSFVRFYLSFVRFYLLCVFIFCDVLHTMLFAKYV